MEKCDNKNGNCFKDAFELFRYNDEGTPEVPFAPSISNIEEEKKKARAFFQRNFTYVGNITGNSTSKEIMNTTFILNFKQFRTLTLGIKSGGSCGSVSRMKVYYIVCKETFIDSVMFVETLAPQNGSKVVFGNCSANSRNNFTRGNLKAFCHSNGSWITDGKIVCSCEEGYESTDERGCSRKFN
jgi:ferredoxin